MSTFVLGIGNSHLTTFLGGMETWVDAPLQIVPVSLWDPALQPSWEVTSGGVRYGDAFVAAVQAAADRYPSAPALCFWGSNAHFSTALLLDAPRLDFVLPDRPDLPPDPAATLMPFDLVAGHVASSIRNHVGLLELVRAAVTGPVYVPPPPPPVRDDRRFRSLLLSMDDEPLVRRVGGGRIAPASVRLKLWLLARDTMREMTTQAGAIFLPVPQEAVEPDGFLRLEYASDALHAAEAYGQLVGQSLAERLAERAGNAEQA